MESLLFDFPSGISAGLPGLSEQWMYALALQLQTKRTLHRQFAGNYRSPLLLHGLLQKVVEEG